MTKYLKKEELSDEKILEISEDIRKGKLVVFPTDTVYGIGTNACDKKACEKIYEVKGRPKQKPLIVLIADLQMLNECVVFINPIEQKLIDAFWPGPLTIKFKKKIGIIPDIVSAGDDYIRVRLVSDGIIFKLIKASGVPIVAPSANLSGSKTGIKIADVIRELGGKVDYILDYGDLESDITSTIVEVKGKEVVILREGRITREDLDIVLNEYLK